MKVKNNYQLLARAERLSVFLQASSRGDTQEAQLIVEASPRVDVKMIDFSADLHALMFAIVFHCLGQANLFILTADLWAANDNDEAFLSAVLHAKLYVVREEAWRSICKENGLDYDKLITGWADFMYVNRFFEWAKKLASLKSEYRLSPNLNVKLITPTHEQAIKEGREILSMFRDVFQQRRHAPGTSE